MKNNRFKTTNDIYMGIIITHVILLAHILIIAILGFFVIFLGGFARNLTLLLTGGILILLVSGFFLYRYIKSTGQKNLQNAEETYLSHGRSFHVSFLGGLVSIKLGKPDHIKQIDTVPKPSQLQLEIPETIIIRELTQLTSMYEKDLITLEEFMKAKKDLFQGKT